MGIVASVPDDATHADLTRGARLRDLAAAQIDDLARVLSALGQSALARPCPGRARLGDGTVGSVARHTADRYLDIARFARSGAATSGGHPGPADHQRIVELD